ncbi:MAG: Hvo_1808 family surface protein [Halolamina sp.]
MRRFPAVVLAALLVVGGVAPAVAAGAGLPVAAESTAAGGAASSSADATASAAPPDPEEDVLGWENGYWYNESLDFDQSDGVSDAERDALVSRTMARVEHIRRLEFTDDVPVAVRSRDQLRGEVSNNSANESLQRFDNVKFEALLLINESADSLAVQDSNAGSSILGYYSPRQNQIVLVAPNESAVELDELTLAHELVHALQDQQFDLSELPRGETRDEVNAIDGVVEGDASYVENRYGDRCGEGGAWNGSCATPPDGAGSSGGGELANLGVYFLKFQPYSDGPNFVASVEDRGGWGAVNALYDDLPESAEQVIEPETYPDDRPANVSLEDRHGDDWQRVRPPGRPDYAEVGQTGIASMLVYPLYDSQGQSRPVEPRTWLNYTDDGEVSSVDPLNYAFTAADGWEGDRMHVYRNDRNETAYVWRIVWESPQDANEFLGTYVEVLDYWGAEKVGPDTYRIADGEFADAFHVSVDGDTVTVVNAPTTDQLSTVRAGVAADDGASTATTADADESDTSTTGDAETTTDAVAPGFGVGVVAVALGAVVAVVGLLGRRR